MTVIYECVDGDVRYQVKQAGQTLRLYTNGVLHTQWNPSKSTTGSIWDLLAAPALLLPDVRRVLVLGVGGGAAIHLLRQWCKPDLLVGVDLDAQHLHIAASYFDLSGEDVLLVQSDAWDFVYNYQGPAFDVIIDDVFIDDNKGSPVRAIDMDEVWIKKTLSLLTERGVLIMNFADGAEYHKAKVLKKKWLQKEMPSQVLFRQLAYENRIAAIFPKALDDDEIQSALSKQGALVNQFRNKKMSWRVKNFK